MLIQKLILIAPIVGSVVLWLLLTLSVLSVGVMIERWWFFRRRRDDLGTLSTALQMLLRKKDFDGAQKRLAESPSIEAEVVAEAIVWHAEGPDAVEQVVSKAVRERRKRLDGGLVFLGTLGNNAPFIGLFGTVLGIVTAFKELGQTTGAMGAATASAGMNGVMSAISEALVATAVGILVAIPAVVAYNIFQKKGADVEENANALGNLLLASLKSSGGGPEIGVAPVATGKKKSRAAETAPEARA